MCTRCRVSPGRSGFGRPAGSNTKGSDPGDEAAVALDGRYRWVIEEDRGVLDALDRPRTIGIGLEGDRVILQLGTEGGWVSLPLGVAADVGMKLQTADITLEQQLKRQQRPE
jgi:hypothetical protein